MQTTVAKPGADRAFGDPHAVAVPHDVRDLRGGPAGQLDPQRRDDVGKLGVCPDRASVRSFRRAQTDQAVTTPVPDPCWT